MKLFGLNITRSASPARTTPPVTRHMSPAAADWLAGRDLDSAGAPCFASPFEQIPWVYRAVSVIADQIATIPFVFSRGERGRENLITSGPLVDFYNQPAPNLTRFDYWHQRILWLLLRGECFRVPIYSDDLNLDLNLNRTPGSGLRTLDSGPRTLDIRPRTLDAGPRHSTLGPRRLARVLILNPDNFQHVIEDGQLQAWRYRARGPQIPLAEQVFLPEEVWFEKLPNPFDYWRGLSPLRVADVAAHTDFAASSYMRGFLENNADNGLIIRTDSQLNDEQREQMAAGLRRRKRRPGAADQSVLLWGATEIVKPTLSSADLQFLENRKFSRTEICAALGVPEEIVSSTDTSKYDVMQGARLNFIENRIAPLCACLEASESATVQALDPSAVGWFDLDSLPIMQQARRNRLAAAKAGFDMGIPFNELNRVFDLGFKALPWGDDGYLPAQLQKLSPSGAAVPAAAVPAPVQSSNGQSCSGFEVRGSKFEVCQWRSRPIKSKSQTPRLQNPQTPHTNPSLTPFNDVTIQPCNESSAPVIRSLPAPTNPENRAFLRELASTLEKVLADASSPVPPVGPKP